MRFPRAISDSIRISRTGSFKRLTRIAESLEERERSLENREIKLEQAIVDLIHLDYSGNGKKEIEKENEKENVVEEPKSRESYLKVNK